MVSSSSIFTKLFAPTDDGGENEHLRKFEDALDRAGVQKTAKQMVITLCVFALVLWLPAAFVLHRGLLISVALLPVCAGVVALGFSFLLKMKTGRRLDQFIQQLEMALRLMGSGVRIGLGLRQALTMVIEEMQDPARYEYMRVVGQTNIGVSVYDALDTLAERMPSSETLMMARAIRIQSQTGGDLGKILEHLANTIKERRRIQRKISALTAEGRASAAILSGLPPFLSGFISLTEPAMGHALWLTFPGHIAL